MVGNASRGYWRWWHVLAIVVLLAIMVLVSWTIVCTNPIKAWMLSLACLAAVVMVIGHGLTSLWRGIFIDERNMISLSRFQMVVWTCLLLSAYGNAVIGNIAFQYEDKCIKSTELTDIAQDVSVEQNKPADDANVKKEAIKRYESKYQAQLNNITKSPSGIKIPSELLALMGISTLSLAGSLLIRESNRTNEKTVDPREKNSPQDSSFADMFMAEYQKVNPGADLGKAQMFIFTIILVMAYAVNLAKLFNTQLPIWEFPTISEGMVTLLGISHAGYLSVKTVSATTKRDPKDQSQPAPDGQPGEGQPPKTVAKPEALATKTSG